MEQNWNQLTAEEENIIAAAKRYCLQQSWPDQSSINCFVCGQEICVTEYFEKYLPQLDSSRWMDVVEFGVPLRFPIKEGIKILVA